MFLSNTKAPSAPSVTDVALHLTISAEFFTPFISSLALLHESLELVFFPTVLD